MEPGASGGDLIFRVRYAGSGKWKSRLEILEKEKEKISLILLDIRMPVMDGYEFLDVVKNNRNWQPFGDRHDAERRRK